MEVVLVIAVDLVALVVVVVVVVHMFVSFMLYYKRSLLNCVIVRSSTIVWDHDMRPRKGAKTMVATNLKRLSGVPSSGQGPPPPSF